MAKVRTKKRDPTANVKTYGRHPVLPAMQPGSMGASFAARHPVLPAMRPGSMGAAVAARQNQPGTALAQPVAQVGAPVAAPPAPAAPAYDAVPKGLATDSEFLAWQAGRENDIQQQNIGFNAADAADASARTEALRRLSVQRPEDLKQADQSYNKAGLFYSGQLGKAKDTIQADYTRREVDTNTQYDQARAARDAARRALESGYSVEMAAQLAAAADRQLQRDSTTADMGGLAGPETQAAIGTAPQSPQAAYQAQQAQQVGANQKAAYQAQQAAQRRASQKALARARAKAKKR